MSSTDNLGALFSHGKRPEPGVSPWGQIIHHALRAVLLSVALAWAAPAAVLENDHVRITIDPTRGGAVTEVVYKRARNVPFVATRGGGIAGSGALLAPTLQSGETNLDLTRLVMRAEEKREGQEQVLVLTATVPAAGLRLERTFRCGADESGFRVADKLMSEGAQAVAVRMGGASRQQPEPWQGTVFSSFGWQGADTEHWTPYHAGDAKALTAKSKNVFWRVRNQYGLGLLVLQEAPAAEVELAGRLPKEKGNPVEFQWSADAVDLAPNATLETSAAVLVDEGGCNGPRRSANRVLAGADMRSGGKSGESMPAFASVVSVDKRPLRLVAKSYFWDGRTASDEATLLDETITPEPGKAALRHFDLTPAHGGLFYLSVQILNEEGASLATASDRGVIDGEKAGGEFGAAWKRYMEELPEIHARGTWRQIGEQLAKGRHIRPARNPDRSGKRLAFYREKFPYYAELLEGAAAVLKTDPALLAEAADPRGDTGTACMGVYFNGPDGPVNAYSKERSGSGRRGLGYFKVLPDKGYRYHMYTLGGWSFGYGVNSEGLCTSGATINCDMDTEAAGKRLLAEHNTAGKFTAPVWTNMLLATCKDVDEALAFITTPDAPVDFTGNMLFVDRAGNAAILESAGILHNIIRRKDETVFATGNYSHGRADGLFKIGANVGWAANTMFREALLGELLVPRKGEVSAKDAVWLMETHLLPGGMCQHGFENPAGLYTSTSCIGLCRTSELLISHGPPCRVRIKRYALE